MDRTRRTRASRRTPRTLTIATAVVLLLVSASAVYATWSIIAIDRRTGQVVIASATCVPQGRFAGFPAKGLMDIQAIVVPGVGVAAAQAGVDNTRQNQELIYRELRAGTAPADIIEKLRADSLVERRQFGIVDRQGRSAGFSGARNGEVSLDMQDRVPGTDIVFSVQGNILASDEVVYQAARAMRESGGTILDRVMAAMEAANREGGDRRCTCASEPATASAQMCSLRTSHVAYLLAADSSDPSGAAFNDGQYRLFLNVTDENIRPDESPDPVTTLRMRYDAWKRDQGGGSTAATAAKTTFYR
ncbi:MAG: DUF1028 domain-containing protein [Longimicrobiales bacterium]